MYVLKKKPERLTIWNKGTTLIVELEGALRGEIMFHSNYRSLTVILKFKRKEYHFSYYISLEALILAANLDLL